MKYIIALFAIISFASCKKEYTCECIDNSGNLVKNTSWKGTNSDKDQFQKKCDDNTTSYISIGDTVTCTLK